VSSDNRAIIVDTNILFSALLNSQSTFAKVLLTSEHSFFICKQALVELVKHKEKIVRHSRLSEDDIVRFYQILLRRIEVYKEDIISQSNRRKAYALCREIDETDTPHVALTLELKGLLWTGDKKLKEELRRKGFDRFFEPDE
jgi:predicted nucleic acid-binding protein